MRTIIFVLLLTGALQTSACKAEEAPTEAPKIASSELVNADMKAELTDRLQNMRIALESGDEEQLVPVLAPPLMIKYMAEGMGVPESDFGVFEASLKGVIRQTMAIADFQSAKFDFENIKYVSTESSKPVALIPTEVNMTVYEAPMVSKGQYVAVRRENQWVVFSASDDNAVKDLRRVFPELQSVKFDAMTVEAVE